MIFGGGGGAPSKAEAQQHFEELGAELKWLGLTKADHKPSPPFQRMVWLGHFQYDDHYSSSKARRGSTTGQ